MKVLTVCSSHKGKPGAVVKNQVESLRQNGVNIQYYFIKRKGALGYLYHSRDLRKFLKQHDFDVVHAHYSLCGFTAAIAGASPLLVSLMGSDGQRSIVKPVLQFFNRFFWEHVIVKSDNLKDKSGLSQNISVIPNGVDLSKFPELDKSKARDKVGFNTEKIHILFLANPARTEKNVNRAKRAVSLINDDKVELQIVHDIPHEEVNSYLHACDVLLLTSDYEGSPNIIKEALAANCKIVSTPVGDVQVLLEGIEGTFISTFESQDVADKIKMAIKYPDKPQGKRKIERLGLDSDQIAEKIIKIYKKLVQK